MFAFLAILSHLSCMLSNPGTLPLSNSSDGAEYAIARECKMEAVPICKRCNGPKPPRAHHCSTCGRCVMKMDHHCPWVNNCVGQNTQKHFVLFLFYVNLMCIYVIGMLSYGFIKCVGKGVRRRSSQDTEAYTCSISPISVVLGALCFMEGLIFGLFTAIMLCDQFTAILTNMTGVEQLKKERFETNRTSYQCIAEVFGSPFSWRWFVPTSVKAVHPKKTREEADGSQLEFVRTDTGQSSEELKTFPDGSCGSQHDSTSSRSSLLEGRIRQNMSDHAISPTTSNRIVEGSAESETNKILGNTDDP